MGEYRDARAGASRRWCSPGDLRQRQRRRLGARRESLGGRTPHSRARSTEFPICKVLYESDGYMIQPRVFRSGDRVAFLERAASRESVGIVNLSGEKHTVAAGQGAETGLAWSPSGEELIYTIVTSGVLRWMR